MCNIKLVNKNLFVFISAFLLPLWLLAQVGATSLDDGRDTTNSSGSNQKQRDSFNVIPDSLIKIPYLKVGENKLFNFQLQLARHPYFNFFGKPLLLVIQEKTANGNESFFYLLLVLFFYFALIRLVFAKYLGDLFTLFFRATLRQQQLREQLLQSPLPSLFLNSLFVLTASLYASLIFKYYKLMAGIDFWRLWVYGLGVLVIVYTGKFIILKTLGWVLKIDRVTDIYLFVVFMMNKMAGIFLLPVLLFMAFPEANLLPLVITLSLFVLVLLLGYRLIVSFRLIRGEIKVNLFHFFLYLCAFEIAPLMLIYKALIKFLERSI